VDPAVQRSGVLESELHKPLPEQFIWTSEGSTTDAARFLRTTFQISTLPPHATLYLAGPREAQVFLNGQRVGDFASDLSETMIGPPVFQVEVADFLRAGTNSIAVRAIAARKTATLKRHPYGFHMGGRKGEWAHHPARHARGAMELLDRRAG
jgi:hypothetical protein